MSVSHLVPQPWLPMVILTIGRTASTALAEAAALAHSAARRARGLLPGLALALCPWAAAQAQTDWVTCADEGGVCRFNGEALVRFGVEGQYTFRVVSNRVTCDTDAFGDPAPGRRKQCQVSANWRQDSRYRNWRSMGQAAAGHGWRVCAAEGEVCVVNGQAQVRFGADGRYVTRTVTGRVDCTVERFGDPAPSVPKLCELQDNARWVLCASEGEACRLPGQAQVRYGANGRYEQRSASGSVMCHNAVFGDPMPGLAKQCEYSVDAAAVIPAVVGPGVGPVRGGGANGLDWQPCAAEGADCRFSGPGMLRYGRDGRWAYQEARDGLNCSTAAFGTDPAPGQVKQCELLRLRR